MVRLNNTWKYVLDGEFNYIAAQVACTELKGLTGYEGLATTGYSCWNYNTVGYWINNIKCKGTETRIVDCYYEGW